MAKRPDGTLEHDILTVLWDKGEAMQPADIQARLPVKLAYTSVATVLTRLFVKGLVSRRPVGRAFEYAALLSESQLAARRIGEVLSETSDRSAALAGFIGSLSKRDVAALRSMLGEG